MAPPPRTIRNGPSQAAADAVGQEIVDALTQSGALYQIFLEQSPVGMAHVDRSGRVTFENHQLRQIIGEGPEEAWIGRQLTETSGIDGRVLEGMMEEGEPFVEVVRHIGPEGGDGLVLSIHGSPIRHPDAGIIGGVILVFDISAERELEARARYDDVEPALRNAALSLPTEHAFLDEAARILGEAGDVDHVFVLFYAEDADEYEEEVRWAREAERSLVPLRLDADDVRKLSEVGGFVHLHRSMTESSEDGGRELLSLLSAEEVLGIPFNTSPDRRGCLLLVRSCERPPWPPAERAALVRQGTLFATLWSWMRAEALHRRTLATVEDCLFSYSFDGSGRRAFSFVTSQIEDLTGVPATALLAGNVDWQQEVVLEEDLEAVTSFERRLREGNEGRLVYRVRSRQGEIRWLRESASPGRDAGGSLTIGGLFSDVTDQKEIEASLREAKQAAETSNRTKSSFLATMSHELRTPLGAIKGFADLLDEEVAGIENLPPEIGEFTGVIRANADRVLGLVTDLFDLVRFQSEQPAVEQSPIAVNPLVADVVARHERGRGEKQVEVLGDLSKEEPIALADARRLGQIIGELVANACKFTERGCVTVSTTVQEDVIEIAVCDTGIGIGEEFLPQLFDPFHQEDNQLNRAFSGSGLGLALTRRLTEAMNGTIAVHTEKGQGSTFTVRLPRADC